MKSTAELLREKVKRDMEADAQRLAVHDLVLEILKDKWKGKQLNKRIATQVEEKLKEVFPNDSPVVYYNKEGYRRIGIKVWGVMGYDYGKRIEMDITHEQTGYLVDPEQFDQNLDARHGSAARERVKEYEELLNNDENFAKIAKAVDAIKKAKADLEKLTADGLGYHVRYYAEDLAGLK